MHAFQLDLFMTNHSCRRRGYGFFISLIPEQLSPELNAGDYSLFALALLAPCTLGLVVWFKTEWFAERSAGKYASDEVPTAVKSEEVQNIGFAIVGTVLIIGPSFDGSNATPFRLQSGTIRTKSQTREDLVPLQERQEKP